MAKSKKSKNSKSKKDLGFNIKFGRDTRFLIGAILAIVFIFIGLSLLNTNIPASPNSGNQNNGNANQHPSSNNQTDLQQQTNTIEKGDIAYLYYVLKLEDGTVYDTNEKDVAEKNGIQKSNYEAMQVTIGKHQIIPGLENQLIGMKVGDEKEITVEPKDGYGEYDESKVIEIPEKEEVDRYTSIKRNFAFPVQTFKPYFKEDPVVGNSYSIMGTNITFTVGKIENKTVYCTFDLEQGDVASTTQWNLKVVEVNDTSIKLENLFEANKTYRDMSGEFKIEENNGTYYKVRSYEIGAPAVYVKNNVPYQGVIIKYENSTYYLDTNHPLAGKTLIFDVKIVNITKAKEYEKPNVKMFVMAFCPFGKQAENAIYPVYQLLGNKVDWEPHFIISRYQNGQYGSLHGQGELNEDMRQICIDKKFGVKKWWPYTMCINQNCNPNSPDSCWQNCAQQNNLSVSEIQACVDSPQMTDWLNQEIALTNQFSVRGSPTIIYNDIDTHQGERSPESYKSNICNYFANQPSECSTVLSGNSGSASGHC